jgi:hypothetical protein
MKRWQSDLEVIDGGTRPLFEGFCYPTFRPANFWEKLFYSLSIDLKWLPRFMRGGRIGVWREVK